MRTLGFNILCVALMLLDASPIPVNCRGDRHRNQGFDVTESIVTDEVQEVGDTWAVVSGNLTLEPIRGFIGVREFGIEYMKNVDDAESTFVNGNGDNFNGNKMTVRLQGLSPSTEYAYRIYVRYNNDAIYYGEKKTFKTKDSEI